MLLSRVFMFHGHDHSVAIPVKITVAYGDHSKRDGCKVCEALLSLSGFQCAT